MSYATEASTADLDNRFSFHPADTVARRSAHADVREACRVLAHYLDEVLPPGRHKSLAHTHLEDVMHRANAAIAQHVEPPAAGNFPLPHITLTDGPTPPVDAPPRPPRPGQPMTLGEAAALGKVTRGGYVEKS